MSARPPNAPTGKPPPMILPKHRQVRRDAEALLRAAGREAEAGHHFVEDQQRAVLLRDLAEEFQVARLGQIQARRCPAPARR